VLVNTPFQGYHFDMIYMGLNLYI